MRGQDIESARKIKIDEKGCIIDINRESGHYKPKVVHLNKAVKFLTRSGVKSLVKPTPFNLISLIGKLFSQITKFLLPIFDSNYMQALNTRAGIQVPY